MMLARLPLGAGRLYGCAPAQDAMICKDSRFSCPGGFSCDGLNKTCSHESGVKVSRMLNVPSTGARIALDSDFCSYITPYLYSGCTCTNMDQGFNASCSISFIGVDTIGVEVLVEPCGSPALMSLDVTEADIGFDWPLASITAGTSENIPVPGLTVGIPVIGDVGVYVDIGFNGNLDMLNISLGLDGCGTVLGVQECGSSIDSDLPYEIISGSFSFEDLC